MNSRGMRMVSFEYILSFVTTCVNKFTLNIAVAANYPFDDHQAPPFSTLMDICRDAAEWLNRDKDNVVAIHCKAGKGRTGTVIAAILLHLGEAEDAEKAMEIYGDARTKNKRVRHNRGVCLFFSLGCSFIVNTYRV